jgi:hypothetical protein
MFRRISKEQAKNSLAAIVDRVHMVARRRVATSTGDLANFLVHKCTEDDAGNIEVSLPMFYGLIKIHKGPFHKWGIRPITPCHAVPQGPASETLSLILKSLLPRFDTIIQSTKELVREIRRLNMVQWGLGPLMSKYKTFIFTADISGFYTNVKLENVRTILPELLKQEFLGIEHSDLKVKFIMELFEVQQQDLVFKVVNNGEEQFWEQHNGLAMGVAASPDIANLYAAYYEKFGLFTSSFIRNRCLLFKRYIDDIFGVIVASSLDDAKRLLDENITYPGLKVNWEVSHQSQVFLDLEIWKQSDPRGLVLGHKPYRKPFNNFERLPYTTGHEEPVLKAAYKSEVYRMAVLSCNESIFKDELDFLANLYYARGYPAKWVLACNKRYSSDAWRARLKETNAKQDAGLVWPLVSEMNPAWIHVSLGHVRDEIIKILIAKTIPPDFLAGSMGRMVGALRRPRNLGDKTNAHNKEVLGINSKMSKILLSTSTDFVLRDNGTDSRGETPLSLDRRDTSEEESPGNWRSGRFKSMSPSYGRMAAALVNREQGLGIKRGRKSRLGDEVIDGPGPSTSFRRPGIARSAFAEIIEEYDRMDVSMSQDLELGAADMDLDD